MYWNLIHFPQNIRAIIWSFYVMGGTLVSKLNTVNVQRQTWCIISLRTYPWWLETEPWSYLMTMSRAIFSFENKTIHVRGYQIEQLLCCYALMLELLCLMLPCCDSLLNLSVLYKIMTGQEHDSIITWGHDSFSMRAWHREWSDVNEFYFKRVQKLFSDITTNLCYFNMTIFPNMVIRAGLMYYLQSVKFLMIKHTCWGAVSTDGSSAHNGSFTPKLNLQPTGFRLASKWFQTGKMQLDCIGVA